MGDALLEVRGVRKVFGGVVANDSLSIDVPAGAIVGLLGPNGSGKTTLFNAISGQQPPDSGSIRFDGREISRLGPPRVARLGVLRTFQHAHVYGRMSCLHNLLVSAPQAQSGAGALLARPSTESLDRAMEVLEFVGLQEHALREAGRVSFGQRKLLEFAMALMTRPRLLLLDEPTAGVAPALVERMVECLVQTNRSMGVTLLFIEHNVGVHRRLAHRVYVLDRGAVVASGAPAEVETQLSDAETVVDWG